MIRQSFSSLGGPVSRLCRVIVLLVSIALIIIMYIFEWIPRPVPTLLAVPSQDIQQPSSDYVPTKNPRRKLILFWNTFFGDPLWFGPPGQKRFINLKCSFTNCEVTTDRNLLDKSDVVGLHIKTLESRPPYKLTNQRWIFFMMESPCDWSLNGWFRSLNGLINWTMTYRLDSDIPFPYGEYYKRPTPINVDFEPIVKNKTKMVAWLVSNCNPVTPKS